FYMKNCKLYLFVFLISVNRIIAQTAKNKTKTTATPILDRELFFGNPEISRGQLSPDGKWISFLKEFGGIMNIWVKKIDEPFENARPLTDNKRPLMNYFWTKDSKYILFLKDQNGDENI